MTLEEFKESEERINAMLAKEDELRAFENATWLERETLETLLGPLSDAQRTLLISLLTENDSDSFVAKHYLDSLLPTSRHPKMFSMISTATFFLTPVNTAYEKVGREVSQRLNDGRISIFGRR